MHEKYTNHFLLYTKIVHVTRTITYVTRTILHDCFVKDNIVTTYCTRLFHAFRKPTMIMIFFSGKKNNFKAMIKKFLLFIRNFFKYCPTYSEQDRCAGKAKNLLKRPNIKYLTTEKKIALEASCICSKSKIAVYTWGTKGFDVIPGLLNCLPYFAIEPAIEKSTVFLIPCGTFRIQ